MSWHFVAICLESIKAFSCLFLLMIDTFFRLQTERDASDAIVATDANVRPDLIRGQAQECPPPNYPQASKTAMEAT